MLVQRASFGRQRSLKVFPALARRPRKCSGAFFARNHSQRSKVIQSASLQARVSPSSPRGAPSRALEKLRLPWPGLLFGHYYCIRPHLSALGSDKLDDVGAPQHRQPLTDAAELGAPARPRAGASA